MCHHTLKGVVCDRHLFLGCSEIKTSYYPHLKRCGLISDIINFKKNMEKRGTEGKIFDLGLMLENSFLGCENYSPNPSIPSGYKNNDKDVYSCKNFKRIADPDGSSVSLRNPLFREIPCATCCERKEEGKYINKI